MSTHMVSNRQTTEFTKLAKQMFDKLDGDFDTFVADFRVQEVYDSEGYSRQVLTPYLSIKR